MAFHLTSKDIYIEEGHILVGRLRNDRGEYVESRLDLNSCLGNDGGHFQWDGEGFSQSAQNVRYAVEGGGQVPILRADLVGRDGELSGADINLAERIQNQNGNFVFV